MSSVMSTSQGTSSTSTLSTSPPSESSPSNQTLVTYTWTVPSNSIKSCLYDDDIYYEYDDYADDVKVESPAFGPAMEPDKFCLRLYPRSTEGCSDVGSLILALKNEEVLRVDRFKVSVTGFSRVEERCVEGEEVMVIQIILLLLLIFAFFVYTFRNLPPNKCSVEPKPRVEEYF